jgi:hypothetical protein
MTDDMETPEEAETNQARSDFAFAIWHVMRIFDMAHLDRRIARDVLCHIAHGTEDHWDGALTAVGYKGQRDGSPVLVVDRSRSTP